MTFKKSFCFYKDKKGKLELNAFYTQENKGKVGIKHGQWINEYVATTFKTKQEKRLAKDNRRINNMVNKNKAVALQTVSDIQGSLIVEEGKG